MQCKPNYDRILLISRLLNLNHSSHIMLEDLAALSPSEEDIEGV